MVPERAQEPGCFKNWFCTSRLFRPPGEFISGKYILGNINWHVRLSAERLLVPLLMPLLFSATFCGEHWAKQTHLRFGGLARNPLQNKYLFFQKRTLRGPQFFSVSKKLLFSIKSL